MTKHILIVDSDEAFALMLHDSIKREMNHHVSICTSAAEAQESLENRMCDLVIVDMGLEDENPLSLLHTLRRQHNELRILVIPLMGEELPEDVAHAGIQGVLTKPFFIGDLAETVEAALSVPMEAIVAELPADAKAPDEPPPAEEIVPSTPVNPPSRASRSVDARTIKAISDLHREIAAEAVILTGPAGIAAQSGEIRGPDAGHVGETLARLSETIAETLASFSGVDRRNQDVLHEGYCEGLGRRLYWMSLDRNWLLICVLNVETPLGMLRYHLRRAASQLASFAG